MFVLILNVHFLNYYVPLRSYARELLSNHLDLTSLGFILPRILDHNCHFSNFHRQDKITRGKAHRAYERSPLPNLTTP